jgi:regulator of RNase E activity RraB
MMREIFNREVNGNLVHIEVNVESFKYKADNPWLFSVFVKYDGLDEEQSGYEEFLEAKESLIIALEHKDKAHYVGSRVVDGWNELYFYSSSSKELDSIVKKILTSSNYIYESNVVRDTKWDFYETQLFPTELEVHHIQSEKIIFLLQEEDDDLSVPREVEHYAAFDTSSQKDRFINIALDIGFSLKDEISTDEYENGIALVKVHAPTSQEVKKVVEELFTLIKKEHGFYEGWSTTLANEKENI